VRSTEARYGPQRPGDEGSGRAVCIERRDEDLLPDGGSEKHGPVAARLHYRTTPEPPTCVGVRRNRIVAKALVDVDVGRHQYEAGTGLLLLDGVSGHNNCVKNRDCTQLERKGMDMNDTAELKDLVRRLERAINDHRLDDLDDIVAVDFVRHCEATPDIQVRSRDDFKQFLRAFSDGFPDEVQTFTHVVAEGDEIGILATYEGTHKGAFGAFEPTGKQVNFTFAGIMKVTSGKISEFWVTWDNMTVLGQLGLLPASGA
jgi:predicted ester cyclase